MNSRMFLGFRFLTRPCPRRGPVTGWLVIMLSMFLPWRGLAGAKASSDISITDLSIVPSTGTFSLLAPWNASGFSEALNSLGELDNDFDSEDDAPILTAASVTWALASSTAETIELTAEADTLVDVPVVRSGAAATSLGSLSTTFEISDAGSGNVDVEFSLDLLTSLSVQTDLEGRLAEAEAILSLEVGGQSVLFHHDLLSVGPSGSANAGFSSPLSESISLSLNTPYFLVLQLDSEARALTVPDSGGLPLSIAIAALVWVHWRQRRGESDSVSP